MQILNKEGAVIAQATEVQYTGKCMGERYVSCKVNSPVPVDFAIGDYCLYTIDNKNETFTLGSIPTVKKVASSGSYGAAYQYDLKFLAAQYELERKMMNDIVLEDRASDTYYTGLATWTTYGTAHELANRIQANLNQLYTGDSAWFIDVINEGDPAELSFNNTNCWDALQMVRTVFNLNYIIIGRTIYIGMYDSSIGFTFEYGKGKGIYDLTRTSEDSTSVITRLRAYGSNRNLPRDYNKKGLVPKSQYLTRLMLPGYSDTLIDYIDSENKTIYGIREGVIEYEDIYPSIEGLTGDDLRDMEFDTKAEGRIDEIVAVSPIYDSEQPTFFVWIKDLGFDIRDHFTPEPPKIAIKDGALGGYEFEISEVSIDEQSYPKAKYRLRLKRNEEDNFTLPDQILNISGGDTFVLLNIYMPDEYVSFAEHKLMTRAQEYLAQNDHTKVSYALTIDNVGIARIPHVGMALKEGKIIHIVDKDLGVDKSTVIQDITIKEGTGGLPNYTLTVSDEYATSTLSSMQEAIEEQKQVIAGDRMQNTRTARQNAITLTALRDSIFDPDGEIKDAFLRTMMFQVGADSMNYALDKTRYFRGVPSNMIFTNTAITLGADVLHHYAYGVGEEPASDWAITDQYSINNLNEEQTYYVAIKARKDRPVAEWIVTPDSQRVDAQNGYYIFNFGILFPVEDDIRRSFVETRGMTSVYGDSIVAGKIQSQDGQTYFDLTNGVLHVGQNAAEFEDYAYLKNTFANGSTTIGGGVVLTDFIGVKDGMNIVAGMTTGSLGTNKVPLLFAGAQSLSDAFNAKFGVQPDGHLWTKSASRQINLYDGEISFVDKNTSVVSLSPQEYAPGTGTNLFSNIISGTSGNGTSVITNGNIVSDAFNLSWIAGHDTTTFNYKTVTTFSQPFSIAGTNGTVVFPGIKLRIILNPSAFTVIEPGDLNIELSHSTSVLLNKSIYSNTSDLSTTQDTIIGPDGRPMPTRNPYIEVNIPAKTLTALTSGTYSLRVITNFVITQAYLPSGYRPDTGSVNMVVTKNGDLTYSWSEKSVLSKFFGNGVVFAKTANEYAGLIVDANKGAALEVRSGNEGIRMTKEGIFHWDKSLNKWMMPGLGIRPRVISVNTTLTDDDNFVVLNSASSITVRLPATPKINQVIMLKTINGSYTVNGNGKTIFWTNTNQPTSFTINNFVVVMLVWMAERNQWMYGYLPV